MENVTTTRESSPSRIPLRLGVVLDSCQVPAWIFDLLRKLSNSEAIDLCVAIVDQSPKSPHKINHSPVMFRLWMALDRWIRRSVTDALRMEDCGPLLVSGRSSPVVLRLNLAGVLAKCDIASIQAADLDLLLHLGRGFLPSEVSDCAHLGAWSVQGSDIREATEIPGQFWDIYDRNQTFMHGPQIIEQARGRTRTIYRSRGITSFLSLALNQNVACRNLAAFLARKLCDAPSWLIEDEDLTSPPVATRDSVPRSLGNTHMVRFLVRWATRIVCYELRKRLFREQWLILLKPASGTTKASPAGTSRCIRPPRDRFYADPFLIESDGRTYVFFEDYRFATRKGLISYCEVDDAGRHGQPRVVLECDYHLSYPYLFTWQDEIYLIPETRNNRTIEMYRANDFPHSWVREAILLPDVAAADSTLLHHQGGWWLFTAGIQEDASPNDALFLYFADSPLGPWTAHPKNPIVSDPRRARPAGSLYFKNGKLIRPGQDCSQGYGYAIQLHQVDVLSKTDYRETPLSRITPSCIPGSVGIHTFNQSEKFQVVDARFLISRFRFLPSFSWWRNSASQCDFGQLDLAADRAKHDSEGLSNLLVEKSGRN